MSVKPDYWKLYADFGSGWSDITADYVTDDIAFNWGIRDNDPFSLVASTGSMTFTLNNTGYSYLPSSPGQSRVWSKGTPIKLEITYDGYTYCRFYGRINKLEPTKEVGGPRRVRVTVLDWLNYAATYPLNGLSIQDNKTADQALAGIVAAMPILPLATSYDTGVNVFPAIFDSINNRSRAFTEISKLALSEFGYIYVKKDRVYGETLTFENYYKRTGVASLTDYPMASVDITDYILAEDGSFILAEDGSYIAQENSTHLVATNMATSTVVNSGEDIINQMVVTAYPKRIDTVATGSSIMYSLSTPMQIGRGETKTFRASYTDPVGGARVNALNMIIPAATTHYLMNSKSDGTGTNLTASLSVTADYYSDAVVYTLRNGSSTIGYITKLNAEGYGVYQYNSIDDVQENTPSQLLYGVLPASLAQQYQRDLSFGSRIGETLLEQNKSPHTILNKVSYHANRSSTLMQAFLNLDVGDLVYISETQPGATGYFYIQGVEAKIMLGGLIDFTWIVKQVLNITAGLSMMAIEFMGGATQDAVNFGYLPQVSNLHQKSYSVWVYAHDPTTELYAYTIMGNYTGVADEGGAVLYLRQTDHKINWIQDGVTAGSRGEWETAAIDPTVLLNHWLHIVVTRDSSTITNQPIIYINGTAVAVTELTAQAGADSDETGNPFVIGNFSFGSDAYGWIAPFNGQIMDARVYDYVLSASDVATLYNGGAGGTRVSTPAVFNAFTVRTDERVIFHNLVLTAEKKLIDLVHYAIGTPVGAPVARYTP